MLVEHILYRKGHDVVTIGPDATIGEAAARLRESNVGALVVSAPGRTIAGIISERDIVRGLAADGAKVLDRPVADLMTADVATCESRATVTDMAKLMTSRRIRHVPVLEDGSLVGIVSIGDIVKNRIGELEAETTTLHDYLVSGRGA